MKGIGFGLVMGWLVVAGAVGVGAEVSNMGLILERSGSDDDVTGRADFRGGRVSSFRVTVANAPTNEVLRVWVGGLERGEFTTDRRGRGSLNFRTGRVSGRTLVLNFDPRGREIEVEDVGDDSLLRHGGGHSSNVVGSAVLEFVNLQPTGVQPAAKGRARYRERRGVRRFDVEVQSVSNGTYAVVVDGVERGTFTTTLGRGKIEFKSPSDDPGKLPLNFDPYGKLIQVVRDGVVVLTGELRAAARGISVCAPGETTTTLANVGPDPDASGKARLRVRDNCRRDFKVEAQDLPVGAYDVVVADVVRGSLMVTNRPDGSVEGEVEFSDPLDDDGDDLPLDFNPAGAVVQVRQGATVFLSGTMGAVSSNQCDVVFVEPSMMNTGADGDAKGKARFRQEDDCDRDFRVEIEDVPVGNYELVVGGVVRGTIPVALVGGETEGEIEFDNDPDEPGEVLLTFDPRGQLVEVRQGATVFLTVTMPE